MPERVLELFEKMPIEIDEVLVTLLFNACAKHCNHNAIQLGKKCFQPIINFLFST